MLFSFSGGIIHLLENLQSLIALLFDTGGNEMSDYILSCGSVSDLTKEHYERRKLHVVNYHFLVDNVVYVDDMGESYPFPKFYQAMRDGAITKTSQVSIGEYFQSWEPLLQDGHDILHVELSSGLSGVVHSALEAAKMLMEKYPQRKIIVVDSLGASSGYGLLMDKLADNRDAGMSMEDNAAWAIEHRLEMHHWFFSTDLKYYVRGGRISRTSGFLGNLLHVCPLLNMDKEGHLAPREKVRTVKKVEQRIVEKMEENAFDGLNYSDKVYLCHSDCLEYAEAIKNMVQQKFPKIKGPIEINWIGTTIGSHSGPGTAALFFWGKKRDN